MEKIICPRSTWQTAQCAIYGLLSLYFLKESFRINASWIPCLVFLFLAIHRCLPFIPGAAFLKLDREGFTACYWFTETRYLWSDIAEFRVITYRRWGFIPFRRFVGLRYTESSGKRHLLVRIVGTLARFDRCLPDNYGMKPKELALLLDRWRLGNAAREQKAPAAWVSSSWETPQSRP